jgi:ribosome-binding factor A
MAKQSKRQRQVGELIRRNLSMVLQQEGSYIYGDALVTVTNVIVAPDLQQAKVYLSIYNTDNKQAVLLMVEEHTSRLRQALAHRIARQIRRIPKIAFYIDETLDEMYHVDGLFKRLEEDNQMGRNRQDDEDDSV